MDTPTHSASTSLLWHSLQTTGVLSPASQIIPIITMQGLQGTQSHHQEAQLMLARLQQAITQTFPPVQGKEYLACWPLRFAAELFSPAEPVSSTWRQSPPLSKLPLLGISGTTVNQESEKGMGMEMTPPPSHCWAQLWLSAGLEPSEGRDWGAFGKGLFPGRDGDGQRT